MQLVDLFPRKGTYKPGEGISLAAVIKSMEEAERELALTCYHFAQIVDTSKIPVTVGVGLQALPVSFNLASNIPRGYGIEAELVDGKGRVTSSASTAIDVQESWLSYPRYGFFTDFDSDRSGESALEWLTRFHINGLQFYDWQYRHDSLVSPSNTYTDPLGRTLSLDTVRGIIEDAHERGIAAMAYLAVYAASLSFAEQHHEWRLFDDKGQPCNFEDFLGLMNPNPDSPWVKHLLTECERTLTELHFDGLHVDQYGEPKVGYTESGESVDLPASFQSFIGALKNRFPGASVTFNAVGNWPIDSLAAAPQDFVYIELWPETPSYQDVFDIVRGGREKSGGKPVVIAQYVPVEHEANIRLSDALIFSLGGSRIELGEEGRLLTDPYFPKHQAIPADLEQVFRRYYDFAVRYGELIGPSAESFDVEDISIPVGVRPIFRRTGKMIALHLVNFTGIEHAHWCEVHPAPQSLQRVSLSFPTDGNVRAVWSATPDKELLGLKQLPWYEEMDHIHVTIPTLDYWTMVVLEIDQDTR